MAKHGAARGTSSNNTIPVIPAEAIRRRNEQFAALHPARARDERAIRLRNAEIRREWKHKVNGTPETHANAAGARQGALARLHLDGHIDADQLAWSQEILAIHEAITGPVRVRCASLEARVDGGKGADATFFESLARVRGEVAYSRWRAAVRKADAVLALIVDDMPISVAARRWRMRNAGMRKLLCDALDLWDQQIRRAAKEVDEASLLAAQAGLF